MANRPHSRGDSGRTSGSGRVSHGSSTGSSRAGSSGYSGRGSSGSSHSYRRETSSSSSSSHRSYGGGYGTGGGRGSSGFSSIIRIIILLVILSIAFRACSSIGDMFSSVTPSTDSSYPQFAAVTGNYDDTSVSSVNTAVASGARDKFTQLLGDGKDTVTVMVYMCGTDLESKNGMATSDLQEMCNAAADNVNIVIETGGTKTWQNNAMSGGTNQRWLIEDSGVRKLGKDLGPKPMTDPATLTDFIRYASENYPANRNILILWDHGGGSQTGYGYDELYPNRSMTVDKIASAIKDGGTTFDIVGFDACLMANMETAIAVAPYADYLIASEETEPGTGWYYTNWLKTLSRNTSTPTTEIGKQIIDDFIDRTGRREQTTLSLVDLAEFQSTIPSKLSAFSKDVSGKINNEEYQTIAGARAGSKEFASSNRIDQVDLVDFCNRVNTSSSKALADALKDCVKYNRICNTTNSYGLSIYFPYRSTKRANAMDQIYTNIGFDADYSDAVKDFAAVESAGQITTQGTSNSLFDILSGSPVSSTSSSSLDMSDLLNLFLGSGSSSTPSVSDLLGGLSIDSGQLSDIASFLLTNRLSSDDLVLSNNNGKAVLSLSEEDWAQVQTVELNVWADDGEGFCDLGLDNRFEFDDDGNLVCNYDGRWIAIDGHICAYYMISDEYNDDDDYLTRGYIPAFINGERMNIIVEFSPENLDGVVVGAQRIYETETEGKGLVELQDGDLVQLVCDYYDYNGAYQDNYYLTDGEFTVSGTPEMTMMYVENDVTYTYCLTDIYDSERYTPVQKK